MYVNGGSVIAIGIIFPILGTIAVAARFLTNAKRRDGLCIEDWLCLPALMIDITVGALMVYGGVNKAIGYHSPPAPDTMTALLNDSPQMQLLLKLEWVMCIIYPTGTGLVRLSFLFFYRRIFRGKAFNIITWTMAILVIGYIFAFTLAWFGICGSNLPAVWTSMVAIQQNCFKTLDFIGAQGIVSFALDVVIWSIPFFWIWRLQMSTAQKLAVTSVFLFGLFVVAASAMRMMAGVLSITYKFGVEQDLLGVKGVNDTMGCISVILFWQYIEQGVGMVVVCLPALRPVLVSKSALTKLRSVGERTWERLHGSTSGRSGRPPSTRSGESATSDEKEFDKITVTRTVKLESVPV